MHTSSSRFALGFSSLLAVACGPSLASMHDRAALGQVQPDAPLHAKRAVTIDAPRDEVWSIVTRFDAWPRWQPTVTRITPPRAVLAGERFVWINGTNEITSMLALVRPTEQLGWTGSVSTAKAIHLWRFSSPTPGTTTVEVEETLDGFLLTWFYGQKDLEGELERLLANLQKAAETKSPGAAGS